MHAPTQPAIAFDADHGAYSVALWAAVAELLERPDGVNGAVDVPVPNWAAASVPWTLLRRGAGLEFLAERHSAGTTLTELAFTGADVDAAALEMLAFDREHPLQLPATLFAHDLAEPLTVEPLR